MGGEGTGAAGRRSVRLLSGSEAETIAFGRAAGRALSPGDVVLLSGELGAGKTRFVEGITQGIEAAAETRSPTFVLVNEYAGRLKLAHCDLYRLSGADEVAELGLDDYLSAGCALAVEWPERARSEFPADALEVRIAFGRAPDDRVLSLSAQGSASRRLLTSIQDTAAHTNASER